MTVRDTSLLAFDELIKDKRLEPDEEQVFRLLIEIGPAPDSRILEALNQKEQATLKPKQQKRTWQINQVTGRRNRLFAKDVIEDLDIYRKPGKRAVHIWRVKGDKRRPEDYGWVKVEKVPKFDTRSAPERKENLQRIRREAERPIVAALNASEAGRTLREFRRDKRQRRTVPTRQKLLFA